MKYVLQDDGKILVYEGTKKVARYGSDIGFRFTGHRLSPEAFAKLGQTVKEIDRDEYNRIYRNRKG